MIALVLLGCDPYARWPDADEVFPAVYTPIEVEDYEQVRVETETWTPLVDLEETALYTRKSIDHRPDAPLEEVLHFGEARPRSGIVPGHPLLSFVGDVMWLGGGWATFADPVAGRLDGGVRVGNLETPASPNHPTERAEQAADYGLYAFNAPVELLDGLPLDVVQVNNNHSLDMGDAGFEQTVKGLVGRGYSPVGFGDNLVQAELGEGIDVAFLSYTWGVNVHDETAFDLAIVPFGHLDERIDLDRIDHDIRRARERGASHVVLLLHWGYEYEYWPDPHFMVLARRMVALGADVLVGHGPHTPQPAEVCAVNKPRAVPGIGQCAVRTADGRPRDAAILYSLGNFGTDLATLPLQVGLIGHVSLDPDGGVSGLGYEAVATVQLDGEPALLPLDDLTGDPAYAEEEARLDALLGTSWERSR